MAKEKKTTSNIPPRKPKLSEDVRNSSNLQLCCINQPINLISPILLMISLRLKKWKIPLRIVSKGRLVEKKLQVRIIPKKLAMHLLGQRR